MAFRIVGQHLHPQGAEGGIVPGNQGFSSCQQGVIPLQLGKADGSHNVRHVAFIPGAQHIVLPGTQLGLGEGVLGLTVKA